MGVRAATHTLQFSECHLPSVHGGEIVANVTPPASLETGATEAAGPGETSEVYPADADVRRFRFELAAHPGSAAQARRMTRAWLMAWAVCDTTCDSAALVVSELVTNAIVHTDSRQIVCELRDEPGRVRIAVCDEGRAPGEPRPAMGRDEEEHGRGLFLVSAVCSAWGAHETGPGLLVWAELPRVAQDAELPGVAPDAKLPMARDAGSGRPAQDGAENRTGIEADPVRGTGAEWAS